MALVKFNLAIQRPLNSDSTRGLITTLYDKRDGVHFVIYTTITWLWTYGVYFF
jgi:hypothetical protein